MGLQQLLSGVATHRVHNFAAAEKDSRSGEIAATAREPKEPQSMKVKWKQIVARLIPAATAIAALVLTIGAQTANVKWG